MAVIKKDKNCFLIFIEYKNNLKVHSICSAFLKGCMWDFDTLISKVLCFVGI